MTVTERLVKFRTPAFLLSLLLLVGVGISAIWGIVQFSRSAEWVEHSYEVLAQIERVEASVRTAESAARAYRLTENPAQYAEYLAAVPQVTQRTTELIRMVADNPAQTARAFELRAGAMKRLGELESMVQLQNERGAAAAREAMKSSRGAVLMQALTADAGEMRDAEQALLEARDAVSTSRARALVVAVVVGELLPILLLSVLLAGLVRENRRVRELERQAREAMRELEAAAISRDRLSEQRRSLGAFAGLLQSCQSVDEAMALTSGAVGELVPDAGGRCYVMRASQNLAETSVVFGTPGVESADLMQPDECWALRRGQPHRTGPGHASMRCGHLGPAAHGDEWTLCVPMIAHGSTLGLLHASGRSGDALDPNAVAALESVGEQLSQTVSNLQLRESLRVQSLRDPLTGLYNRRYLEENLYRELQRCERRALPLSVMMLDVDHFKRFNDEHGHGAGDALLARVGEVLVDLTRGEDISCRYGGEEFTIVLPEADLDVALRRAEQIRAAIASISVIHMRHVLGPVSMSIGVSCFPRHGSSPERLLASADSALYRAKALGRDRVVASD